MYMNIFGGLNLHGTLPSQLSFVTGFFAEHTATQNKQSRAASELKYIVVQFFSYRGQENYLFRLHEVSIEWITSMELSATIHRQNKRGTGSTCTFVAIWLVTIDMHNWRTVWKYKLFHKKIQKFQIYKTFWDNTKSQSNTIMTITKFSM